MTVAKEKTSSTNHVFDAQERHYKLDRETYLIGDTPPAIHPYPSLKCGVYLCLGQGKPGQGQPGVTWPHREDVEIALGELQSRLADQPHRTIGQSR